MEGEGFFNQRLVEIVRIDFCFSGASITRLSISLFLLKSAKTRLFLRGYFDGRPLNGANLVEFALSGAVYWI